MNETATIRNTRWRKKSSRRVDRRHQKSDEAVNGAVDLDEGENSTGSFMGSSGVRSRLREGSFNSGRRNNKPSCAGFLALVRSMTRLSRLGSRGLAILLTICSIGKTAGWTANVLTLVKMLDHATLNLVAEQMMSGRDVTVAGRTSRVFRTGAQRLRTVRFLLGEKEYQAIEQNPEKPSRWGKLAREGRRVVQVRDLTSQKYVAAVVDGKVTEYSR